MDNGVLVHARTLRSVGDNAVFLFGPHGEKTDDRLEKSGNESRAAGSDAPEKKEVKIGFIPLTDCASVSCTSALPRTSTRTRFPAA